MNPLNASQSTVCGLAWKRYSRQTPLRDVAPALNGRASLARVRPCQATGGGSTAFPSPRRRRRPRNPKRKHRRQDQAPDMGRRNSLKTVASQCQQVQPRKDAEIDGAAASWRSPAGNAFNLRAKADARIAGANGTSERGTINFQVSLRLPTAPALANASGEDFGMSAPGIRRAWTGYTNGRKQ